MKNSILLLMLIGILFIAGCSLVSNLKKTATQNMEIDRKLPKYELNKENLQEIHYQGRTYMIQAAKVDRNQLNKPIGKVAETITINEHHQILSKKELRKIEVIPDQTDEKRTHLNFGWVYSIKGVNPDEEVAVTVNHQFLIAKRK
ncbi:MULTISPECIES: NisI/SpaI family lantibiotic immunity lipoprotein [Geobacillus]|uniref:SpaI n=3 Tax=Geobacillus thermoleovorans group TaxID=1505648 RepID=A0A1V9BRJ0_9BACL|nr:MULTISPECIES: NisI/SpaI family lantibiotic immunity lipoprotein [Geobacillus]ASS87700.1 SpaI [Geobacillus lituanicus]ATA58742.1 SpaI [Geobacillus stearothermophilus]AMQ22305.1 SpaI [Geobacillus sp. JS12]AST00712.1 SpaI [Geobacillus thermocatenulatus]AUI36588.1 NisI/SpaI family lantibiotic immunity lipoprotein [[Bacillus] caldolyticus]